MTGSATRRQFLKQFGAAGVVSLGGVVPSLLTRAVLGASSHSSRVLVLVQLAGGNDGLNTLIPFAEDAYYKARPGLAIPRNQVLKLNDQVGLHPRLTRLKELYDEGNLAVIQGVGYPKPDRSHFRSMDIWHTAQPENETRRDGWLGRALDWQFDAQPSLAEGLTLGMDKLPLAFVSGRISVPTLRQREDLELIGGSLPASQRVLQREILNRVLSSNSDPTNELNFLRRTTSTALATADRLRELAPADTPASEYPATGLAEKLKLVAQFIAADLPARIYFVSLDGFDTHAQQEAGHTALLVELAEAMHAFQRDLAGRGQAERVMLATFSEFGRRVAENGSLGTDHGAASMLFTLSPKTAGLFGQHPSLTDLDDGDLKFTTDFRSVYSDFLDWLQIPAAPVLGAEFSSVGFAEG